MPVITTYICDHCGQTIKPQEYAYRVVINFTGLIGTPNLPHKKTILCYPCTEGLDQLTEPCAAAPQLEGTMVLQEIEDPEMVKRYITPQLGKWYHYNTRTGRLVHVHDTEDHKMTPHPGYAICDYKSVLSLRLWE